MLTGFHRAEVDVLRAVVVDDEADLRMLARFWLEDDGAAQVVGEARDAQHALALINHVLPDVAIIDIHLPDMNGIELIRLLRRNATTTRLIAYSSDDLALTQALNAGADTAVLKTGRSEELLAAVGT